MCVCVFQRIWGGELVLLVVWPLWSLWWSMAIGGSPLNKTVSSKWDTCVTGRAITNWQNDRYRRVTFCTTADLNSICWGTWRFSFVLVTRGTLVITAMRIWLGVPKGSPWFATLFTLRVWPFLGIAFKHASSSAVNKGVWKKHAVNKTCHDRQVLFKKGSFFYINANTLPKKYVRITPGFPIQNQHAENAKRWNAKLQKQVVYYIKTFGATCCMYLVSTFFVNWQVPVELLEEKRKP